MAGNAGWMTLPFLFLPLAGALAALFLTRIMPRHAAIVLALAPALVFAHFASFLPDIAAGQALVGGVEWVPALDLRFSWYLDGLSLTFALLISGIGTLIVLYAGAYMQGHPHMGRFMAFMLLFMGAMLGLVVSDGFLMLFVYWELTSLASFLLIGFDHQRQAARRAAFQALVVTGAGGLLLLAGLLLIWNITGVSRLSELGASGAVLRESPHYLAALLLVLGGAFTKSAQFPFHVWLPNAMEAPTPVSAYLHSATMVKAGVYLLMRLNPSMGGTPAWEILLPLFGAVTLVFGAVMALRQRDLKQMLAWTTVASLGLLVMLTGSGSPRAIDAAVLYLIAHSLFKGALFMVAGIVDHETGTRDAARLGGLRKAMPLTFVIALGAALSMGGLPPFGGFLAKEEIYAALAEGSASTLLLIVAAICGNALMFAVAFAVGLRPFIGAPVATPEHPHEAPPLLLAGPAVLALGGLLTALFSMQFHRFFSSPMASAVAGSTRDITVSPLPHVGLPLALSLLTVAAGMGLYRVSPHLRARLAPLVDRPGPDRGFDYLVSGLVTLSFMVTRLFQTGRLEFYVTSAFVVLAATLLVPPFIYNEWPAMPAWPSGVLLHEMAFMLIALCGLVAVLLASNRLTAIVSLGIQGFAVAVLFLLFGAPDLSFTQFMVETLSVVILALVITRLRLSPSDHRSTGQKILDGSIAIACGTGFALLLMRVTAQPFDSVLTEFFNTWSKTIAHGANVVNVIIVDFRGTDTLGEIAVVLTTGMAILTLMRMGSRQRGEGTPEKTVKAARTGRRAV